MPWSFRARFFCGDNRLLRLLWLASMASLFGLILRSSGVVGRVSAGPSFARPLSFASRYFSAGTMSSTVTNVSVVPFLFVRILPFHLLLHAFYASRFLHSHRSLSFTAARKFTKTHEWVEIDNGVGTIGITEHAAKELGDIVFVEVGIRLLFIDACSR